MKLIEEAIDEMVDGGEIVITSKEKRRKEMKELSRSVLDASEEKGVFKHVESEVAAAAIVYYSNLFSNAGLTQEDIGDHFGMSNDRVGSNFRKFYGEQPGRIADWVPHYPES